MSRFHYNGVLLMLALILTVNFGSPAKSSQDSRKWTDSTGTYSIVAEFVEIEKGIVVLRKANRSTIRVPLNKLSRLDRQYIESLNSTSRKADKVAPVIVEHVSRKPRRTGGGLGTTFYSPSEKEKPFFQKLATAEKTTGGLAGDYDISKKDKSYVGWFGIVRGVEEQKDKNQTVLLVEHKYFDGLTDAHIQALSFNGSGDFDAVISGVGHKIEPLTLVKVYGVVSVPKAESKPEIKGEFVRNWHWGTFTFLLASGKQRGSAKWRKLNSVDLKGIYDPYPDDQYYERRLGKR